MTATDRSQLIGGVAQGGGGGGGGLGAGGGRHHDLVGADDLLDVCKLGEDFSLQVLGTIQKIEKFEKIEELINKKKIGRV